MKPEVSEKLSEARDFYALTKAVLSMCEPYGPVHSFRMIHNRGAARVACLIELESPKLQQNLARAIGVRVLNGAACLEIPVEKDFGACDEATIPVLTEVHGARQDAFKANLATS